MEKKQQFNIYLEPSLVRRVKHAAIDTGQSLSKFVEDALIAHMTKLLHDAQKDAEGDKD